MILKGLTVGPFMSNCYVVGCEQTRQGMIVDPGADSARILKAVRDAGLTIKIIVATHIHGDHISALSKVKEATGAPFAVHEAEGSTEMMRAASDSLAMMMGVSSSGQTYPEPDRLLVDGDIIEVGTLRFTVLHTPGHSPGGICLVGHGVAFVGDTLFNMSIGRTDFPGSDYDQIMNSIRTKLMVLPDETRVFCGHMQDTTIGFERKHNPFVLGLY